MVDQSLLKIQKNAIYKIISENDLNPNEFTWGNVEYEIGNSLGMVSEFICSKITCRQKHYFIFNTDGTHFKPNFSPGFDQKTTYINNDYLTWKGAIKIFEKWLSVLKIEISEPDLWADLEKYKPTIGVDFDSDGEGKFSYEDVKNIETQLGYIKNKLNESFALNESHNKRIDNQLEYLVESAKRQNIRDWRNIAIATFFNIMVIIAISPDKMPLYWQIIRDGLKQVRHLLGI